LINQKVVNKVTNAIYLYNTGCNYTEIAKYLEVSVEDAVKMVQAANIIEGIEL
jgi:hypothetical protein